MGRWIAQVAVLLLVLASCGGDSETRLDDAASGSSTSEQSTATSEGDGTAPSGSDNVVDPQPAGQAIVSVDGAEYELTESAALACSIRDDAITFSFWVGDNSVVLGGGANLYDEGWLGGVDLRIADPVDEVGPVRYYPDLALDGDRVAIDGDSMSYSGPMLKQPPNDGTNPPPLDAGEGTISVTCG